MRTHLWEIKHSYYCNESNYFQNGCCEKYESFADFNEVYGNVDLDYNLLFRWDWRKRQEQCEEDNEDDYEEVEGDVLYLFWMQQRKGKYTSCMIQVNEADEPAVRAFLQRAFNHLAALWLPILFEPNDVLKEVQVPNV